MILLKREQKRVTALQYNRPRGGSFNPLVAVLKIYFNTAQLANVHNGYLAVCLSAAVPVPRCLPEINKKIPQFAN